MKANLYVLYSLYIKEVLIIFTSRTYIFFSFLWWNNKDYVFLILKEFLQSA